MAANPILESILMNGVRVAWPILILKKVFYNIVQRRRTLYVLA